MTINNEYWAMSSHPKGMPNKDNFTLVSERIDEPQFSQVMIKTLFLTLDPYMRGRMRIGPSYAPGLKKGEIMTGEIVGIVEISKSKKIPKGSLVRARSGWTKYSIMSDSDVVILDDSEISISTSLGILGMPGLTAYHGLLEVGKPKAGETLVVSAASGAVGAIVGQIAKINGCRVIGTVGNDMKADYITKELGFDHSINYKKENIEKKIMELCPNGIDIYFDNVGGEITDTVMNNLAYKARVIVCGQISQYNATKTPIGPRNLWSLIRTQSKIEGILVSEYGEKKNQVALARMSKWISEGKLKYKEDIIQGFENAPLAFQRLFTGENFGKLLIKVSDL
ncbi:MAG: NADP-dependent oxidoreductase [Dehalococcoidia bacterium]